MRRNEPYFHVEYVKKPEKVLQLTLKNDFIHCDTRSGLTQHRMLWFWDETALIFATYPAIRKKGLIAHQKI